MSTTVISRGESRVLSVEERFSTPRSVPSGKDPVSGQIVYELSSHSIGWYARLTESSAMRTGDTKPDLKAGDTVRLTLERIDR